MIRNQNKWLRLAGVLTCMVLWTFSAASADFWSRVSDCIAIEQMKWYHLKKKNVDAYNRLRKLNLHMAAQCAPGDTLFVLESNDLFRSSYRTYYWKNHDFDGCSFYLCFNSEDLKHNRVMKGSRWIFDSEPFPSKEQLACCAEWNLKVLKEGYENNSAPEVSDDYLFWVLTRVVFLENRAFKLASFYFRTYNVSNAEDSYDEIW